MSGVWVRAAVAVVVAAMLAACGSHGSSQSTLPPLASGHGRGAASTATDVIAINAGGAATGAFSADNSYAATGTWTYKVTNAIDTSAITNPAPTAVYQTEREGGTITYNLGGLTPNTAYTVRLSFAELWWTSAGQRVMNVSINGSQVMTNFDIFATAGARFKATAPSFAATSSSSGTIVVTLTAVKDNAAIGGLEVLTGAAPTPTPTPTGTSSGGVYINSGGSATGVFSADTDVVGNNTWTYGVTNTIDTSGVTSPAPAAVYADEREGSTISYTIPNLVAGAGYTVRLDFAELWWTSSGQRTFNVKLNGSTVLSNYDIFAAAGARFRAVSPSFTTTASSSGTIAIVLTAVTNYAAISGIEVVPASGTPTPPPSASFNDYVTFGYDNAHDVYNPNTTAITPASISSLHLAWQTALGSGDYNTQTQPVLATEISGHAGVLFVGGGTGNVYAYDATTGSLIWTRNLGQELYTCGSGTAYFGIGGTVAYDPSTKSLYVMGNSNTSTNAVAQNVLYHLDAATGAILGSVNIAPTAVSANDLNFSHVSVTLNNGLAYVATSSTCDIASWRGRVVTVNVPAMTLANTFFTIWDPNNSRGQGAQPYGGAGIWGWGGVSIDPSGNVLTGVGNADDGYSKGTIQSPFVKAPTEYVGYAETLLELSPNIGSVIASNHPMSTSVYGENSAADDLDVHGTPVVFQPIGTGCGTMIAIHDKFELSVYTESGLSNGPVAQYQMGPVAWHSSFLGGPAYSPATGLLYSYVATSEAPTLFSPGMVAINPGCGSPSVAWRAAFGADSSGSSIPRSVPAVSAGGVVFAGSVNGTGGSVWAVNASSGTVLNNAAPILSTSGYLRMPATIDGKWVFVLDNSGNMYGMTIDPSYPTIQAKRRANDSRQRDAWGSAAVHRFN